MSFTCPPSELVLYVLESLSFAGQNGLSLTEMWNCISIKLNLEKLDNFQKQIIWQWLFFHQENNQESLQLYVIKNSTPVVISPNYTEFTSEENAEDIFRVKPTDDTQWRYLTGLEPSKKMKLQLGEKPFELLVEIARHGSAGILSSDLCKNTGQDPRSLPMRFKKLEEFGFISKKAFYNASARLHTNMCVHFKFAKTNTQFEDSIVTRNANRFKQLIVQTVKEAPNHLRVFKELKAQLKLDSSKSAHKFFDAMVEKLHKNGNVEKVMVRDSETDRLVYCIKFIKDLPRDLFDVYDYIETLDNSVLSIDTEVPKLDNLKPALVNVFFPFSNQMYEQIRISNEAGAAVKEVVRNLSGNAAYRPFVRLLDSISSYVLDDSHNLIPIKNYPDAYDEESIVRTYDFHGKYRFYRYYIKGQIKHESVKKHKERAPQCKPLDISLLQLNNKLFTPLGKTPKGDFMSIKKRIGDTDVPIRSKRTKRVTKPVLKDLENDTIGIAKSSLDLKTELHLPEGRESFETDIGEASVEPEVVSIADVGSIVPAISVPENRKRRSERTQHMRVSLKGKRRRAQLLELIKELGGVTYTTAKLRRSLDKRLGVTTMTDIKTLARDISILIAARDLEVEDVEFDRGGQKLRRRLLILTEDAFKPTREAIENAREECLVDIGARTKLKDKRVVDGELKLFETSENKPQNKNKRLESLDKEVKVTTNKNLSKRRRKRNSKQPSQDAMDDAVESTKDNENIMDDEMLVPGFVSNKNRRKVKPNKVKSEDKQEVRRYRQIIAFDNSDAITLFRAVVISKCFKRGSIDFEQIASIFYDTDEKAIKHKWTVVRKRFGGSQAINKGKKAFENMVMKAIDDELIPLDALENIKLSFFLELWKETDKTGVEIFDNTPLFDTVEENLSNYVITDESRNPTDLFDQLEDNSMRQKESILAGRTFFDTAITMAPRKRHEELRTVLKAIVFTPEELFTGSQVKQVLSRFSNEDAAEAAHDLMRDREMLYFGSNDVPTKFVLTDKVYNSINVKLKPKFFNQAASFSEMLVSLSESKKGLILSQAIGNGHVASLLQFISAYKVDLCHIDKFELPEGYESRLVDKEKLACDIVAFSKNPILQEEIPKVPVPIGKPCEHVWLDLNGNINKELWTKIIVSILYYIIFRPGVPAQLIYSKLQTVLELHDFFDVMTWLENSKCIHKGDFDGYSTSETALSILGF